MADIQVSTGDRESPSTEEPHPIVIVLDHLRSAYNVGNIYRLAEITHARKIVTCGYTATPPHPKVEKTARGCDKLVATEHYDCAVSALTALRDEGYQIIGVETVDEAPTVWDLEIAFPVALVFGNEALGIDQDALALCDGFVQLPVYGQKNSMNVSNCAAVVLYRALELLNRR